MYDKIVLDSSLFKKRLSSKALSLLFSAKLHLPETFNTDVQGYNMFLRPHQAQIFVKNVSDIVEGSFGKGVECGGGDTYHSAIAMSKTRGKTCVMTADKLLMDRIIFNGIDVDIYNLDTDSFIYHINFPKLRRQLTIAPYSSGRELVRGITSGVALDSDDGSLIVLGKQINLGTEGKIFEVRGDSTVVAKVYPYEPVSIKVDHLRKLKRLAQQIDVDWCTFPKNLLMYHGKVVGFLMPNIKSDTRANDSLYQGDDEAIDDDSLNKHFSHNFLYASQLLAQVKYLATYGIAISDYNESNFSTYTKDSPIVFYDTDSFSYMRYFGKTLEDPSYSREYELDNKESILQLCEESALKSAFKIFSLGLDPMWGKQYIFDQRDNPMVYRKKYFSTRLYNYFSSVFSKKDTPSISSLLHIAMSELSILREEQKKDITIGKLREAALKQYYSPKRPTNSANQEMPASEPKSSKTVVVDNNKAVSKRSKKGKVVKWILFFLALTAVAFLCGYFQIIPDLGLF